jgi:hypothetical protein
MRRVFPVIALATLVGACDQAEEPFRQQVVVEAVLISGEAYPPVRLTRTFPITQPIPADRGAVRGADVRIERLGPDGAPDELVRYAQVDPGSGEYHPVDASGPVLPLRRYRITIAVPAELRLVPEGRLVQGESFTPDTFRVVQPPPDTVRYAPLGPRIEVRTTRSVYPARQTIYMFSIVALDPDGHDLTPVYAELVDPQDRHRFVENSSPLLNEESYERLADGTVSVPVPWFAIAFYGPNRLIMSAVDDALYDFIRSRDAQFSPGTLSPGEIPEVLTNLSNGVGVFGSVSRVRAKVVVQR